MTGVHKNTGGEQKRSKFEREQRNSAEFSQKLKSRKLPEKKFRKIFLIPYLRWTGTLMILLTNLYDDYIDGLKLTEQNNT